jgi:hypothetical protein
VQTAANGGSPPFVLVVMEHRWDEVNGKNGLEADLMNITLNGNLVRRTGLGAGCGQFAQSCHLMGREE